MPSASVARNRRSTSSASAASRTSRTTTPNSSPPSHLPAAGRAGAPPPPTTHLAPAEPGDRVSGTHRGQEAGAELLQQRVAVAVAEGVVDLLEPVEVEHGDGGARLRRFQRRARP